MSIDIMRLVFQNTELEGTPRLVMLALADNASDEGICWPSFQTIADKANTDKSYAIKVLAALEKDGYIARRHRDNASNAYLINVSRLQSEKRPPKKHAAVTLENFGGCTVNTPAGVLLTPPPVLTAPLKPSIEPPIEPSKESLLTDILPKPEQPKPQESAQEPAPDVSPENAILLNAFLVATQLPVGFNPRMWVDPLISMRRAGVTAEDVTEAVKILQGKGYQIATPKSVMTTAINEAGRRARSTTTSSATRPGRTVIDPATGRIVG